MRKSIILNTLLFFTVAVFSQKDLKARLTYSVSLKLHDKNSNLTPEQKNYNSIAKKSGERIFFLDIENTKSFFYENPKMKSDGDKRNDLLSAMIRNDKFYYDTKDSIYLIEKNFLGESFIVMNKPSLKWEFLQEKSKIGDYISYKANSFQEVTNRIGKKIKKKVSAWYTFEVPVKIGIMGYQGLPGLILRLETEVLVYELKSVEIKKTLKFQINKPNKGKIISKDEYNDILLKKYH